MKRRNAYIVSGIGAIVLFAAFLTYNAQPVPLWNWIKLSDILTIVGGLMFVIPFYTLSVHAKTREHAPNPWVWQLLPVVGMFLMVVGLLIPNDFVSLGSLALCDVLYFLGCVGMLMIFVYPFGAVNDEMLEDDVDERAEDAEGHAERPTSK
ncbi:permease [Bifidobacterium italicum]|uniref:Permease n=1 Tax=Bifidobacterium italicum TaxID=1960968 RepID=A0A2A2EIW3_9BIFI|nr:permease [Bifidobacterium italicum]PAU69013.1 permease [Bifidobacterium italicum]